MSKFGSRESHVRCAVILVLLLAVSVLGARSAMAKDLEFAARNGDDLTGQIDGPLGIDTYLIRPEAGRRLRVRVVCESGEAPVVVALARVDDEEQALLRSGRRVRLNVDRARDSDYRVVVRAAEIGTSPRYRLSIRSKIRTRRRSTRRVRSGRFTVEQAVPALSGERIEVRLQNRSGRTRPRLPIRIEDDRGRELRSVDRALGLAARVGRSGLHRVVVDAESLLEQGEHEVKLGLVVRRRRGRRRIDVRPTRLPVRPDVAFVGAFDGRSGGELEAARSTGVRIGYIFLRTRPGALERRTFVTLSEAEPFDPPAPGIRQATGGAFSVGPPDLDVPEGEHFELEMPFGGGLDEHGNPVLPRAFVQQVDGTIAEIPRERVRLGEAPGTAIVEHDVPGTYLVFARKSPVRVAAADATDRVLVVGKPDTIVDEHSNAGSVEVYERSESEWRFVTELVAPDPEDEAEFGRVVAIEGSRFVVGASSAHDSVGASVAGYVYERVDGHWVLVDRLVAPPGDSIDGDAELAASAISLDLSGDTIVVGGQSVHRWWRSGRVLTFDRVDGWWRLSQQIFEDRVDRPHPNFANQVTFADGRLVVTVPWNRSSTDVADVHDPGVQIYGRASGSWQLEERLVVDGGPRGCAHPLNAGPPSSLAADADHIAVGFTGQGSGWAEQAVVGSVVVFDRRDDSWVERALIRPPLVPYEDLLVCPLSGFGTSMSLQQGRLLVGAPRHGGTYRLENGAGGAFLFSLAPEGTELLRVLAPPVETGGRWIGGAVRLIDDGGTAVLAGVRPQQSGQANELGRALLFDLE